MHNVPPFYVNFSVLCDAKLLYPWFWISDASFPLPTGDKPHVHANLVDKQ